MGRTLFGLVSPRGDFKLKTTLHGWQLMVDKNILVLNDVRLNLCLNDEKVSKNALLCKNLSNVKINVQISEIRSSKTVFY